MFTGEMSAALVPLHPKFYSPYNKLMQCIVYEDPLSDL